MKENLIIIPGGGPTAVLNCSLYGAVREAQASGLVEHVYGAVGGTGGLPVSYTHLTLPTN